MTETEFKNETDPAVRDVYEGIPLKNAQLQDLECGLTFEKRRKRAEKIAKIFVGIFALCYLIFAYHFFGASMA